MPLDLRCLAALAVSLAACSSAPAPPTFAAPEPVTLRGYDGDAMEPFLSRDGQVLFFNDSNAPGANTDLHWAFRVDDLTFDYQGRLDGVNTPSLDAVASMASDRTFYFVSLRSYAQTASTIYRGHSAGASVVDIALVPGVSQETPGMVNFDAEISDDGNTLYFVDSHFGANAMPDSADLVLATRSGDGFTRGDPALLAAVNTPALEYAPATSFDELELYFTRWDGGAAPPTIWRAARESTSAPFAAPTQLDVLTGLVEAPTVAPSKSAIYFHRLDGTRYVLYRSARTGAR